MSQPTASIRIGLFTLLLGVLMLALFASLLVADRALRRAGREALKLDAHGAALVVERDLRLKAGALDETFGPLLPSSRTTRSEPTAVPPGFDAVWVLDTTGRIIGRPTEAKPRVDAAMVEDAAHPGGCRYVGLRG